MFKNCTVCVSSVCVVEWRFTSTSSLFCSMIVNAASWINCAGGASLITFRCVDERADEKVSGEGQARERRRTNTDMRLTRDKACFSSFFFIFPSSRSLQNAWRGKGEG
jgi:hypothetical protein